MKNKSKLAKNKGLYGYIFIAPLLFGLIVLFGIPLMQSIVFSFCKITIAECTILCYYTKLKRYVEVSLWIIVLSACVIPVLAD